MRDEARREEEGWKRGGREDEARREEGKGRRRGKMEGEGKEDGWMGRLLEEGKRE